MHPVNPHGRDNRLHARGVPALGEVGNALDTGWDMKVQFIVQVTVVFSQFHLKLKN